MRVAFLVLGIAAVSCSRDTPTQVSVAEVNFPLQHRGSAWAPADSVVFQDIGAVCVTPYGYYPDSAKAGIWIASADGTGKRRLVSAGTNPTWSNSLDEIVFEWNGSLVATRTDALSFRLLTVGASDQFPDWSPVENVIVFESTRQMQGGHRSIWTVNADGSGLARVGGEPNESYRMPAWSSDGQRIVHVRYPPNTNGPEIYTMNRDGTNSVRVTTNAFDDAYPRFSPDGTLIAFERLDSRGVPQIWIMNADGTAEEQLTIHGGTRAAWSNDGSSIIYSRYDPRSAELGNGVLWRHDLETHAEAQMSAPWPSTCP